MNLHTRLAAAILLILPLAAQAADLLTPAQVEKIVGVSGVQMKPSKVHKTGISFDTAKGEAVIALNVQAASSYEVWKAGAGSQAEAVPNVGAEAFWSKTLGFVCFKKSDTAVCVTSMQPLPRAVPVSRAQLIELARATAANIQ